MKTIRLVEAPTTASTNVRTSDITNWQAAWDDPMQDKLDVARNILSDVRLDSSVIDRILKFGRQFVVDWFTAMKLDEIGYNGNEFVALLRKNPAGSESTYLRDATNFTKIYNVYANNNMNTEYFKDSTYLKLLTDSNVYSRPEKDFNYLFKTYDDLREAGLDLNTIKNVFIEKGTNNIYQNAQVGVNVSKLDNPKVKARQEVDKTVKDAEVFAKTFIDGLKKFTNNTEAINTLTNELQDVLNVAI